MDAKTLAEAVKAASEEIGPERTENIKQQARSHLELLRNFTKVMEEAFVGQFEGYEKVVAVGALMEGLLGTVINEGATPQQITAVADLIDSYMQ
jgi:hypothetical protein